MTLSQTVKTLENKNSKKAEQVIRNETSKMISDMQNQIASLRVKANAYEFESAENIKMKE